MRDKNFRTEFLKITASIPDEGVMLDPARLEASHAPSDDLARLIRDADDSMADTFIDVLVGNSKFSSVLSSSLSSARHSDHVLLYQIDIRSQFQSGTGGPNFGGYLLNIAPGVRGGDIATTVAPVRKSGLPPCTSCGFTGCDLEWLKTASSLSNVERPTVIHEMEDRLAFELDRLLGSGAFDPVLLRIAKTVSAAKGNRNTFSVKVIGRGTGENGHVSILSIFNLRPRVLSPAAGRLQPFWSEWEARQAAGTPDANSRIATRAQRPCPQCRGLGLRFV